MYTAQTLRQGLKTRRFGSKIYTFETIDSTNSCARALAACWAQEGTVIIAEHQTGGRGRMGRTWSANPLENLTFSVILRPTAPAEEVNLLPLYVGVAVADAVTRVTGLEVRCKWPNDLLIGGLKVAGILLEGSLKESSIDYVVIGIGLNVNQRTFPLELAGKATSLALQSGHDYDREELFREIMRSLESRYRAMLKNGFGGIIPLWVERSRIVGRRVSISQNGTVLTGTVKGLSVHGGLIMEHDGVEQVLLAGDVSILDTEQVAH
jgi:BirA family biotin operon repressor/biotin-[acetyl-CoA-carboxylase] ligase